MTTLENSTTVTSIYNRHRGGAVALVAAMLLSTTLAALSAYNGNGMMVIGVGFALLGVVAVLLAGNVFKWAVYCFFCVQYTASYFFMPTASVAIGIVILFFPIAFFEKDSLSVFRNIPNKKSLLLMLVGGITSVLYTTFANYGLFKYHIQYDIYFLLGLIFAYQMYFLFKLKILDPKKVVECIGVSAAFIIGVLIIQYIRHDWTLMFKVRFGASIMILENPNIIAMYIDMALPCAFFTAIFEKKNLAKKILFYGLSLFYVCILFMTASRGSLPGIVILSAYFIWLKRSNKLFVAFMLICMAVMSVTIGAITIQRVFDSSEMDMISNIGRVELLRVAFEIIKENHYFFGIGMHNYGLIKYDYGISSMMPTDANSHNVFIDAWLGWGILGLLGWLIFNVTIVKSIMHKCKNCVMANSVVFAIIIFSIHGLVDSAFQRPRIMSVYFTLAGIGFFLMSQIDDNRKELTFTEDK